MTPHLQNPLQTSQSKFISFYLPWKADSDTHRCCSSCLVWWWLHKVSMCLNSTHQPIEWMGAYFELLLSG
jgi:hypothetical protein